MTPAPRSEEQVREIIEDAKGDLYLYEIGEIDRAKLEASLRYAADRLREHQQ